MNKSLLSILNAENDIIATIRCAESRLDAWRRELVRVMARKPELKDDCDSEIYLELFEKNRKSNADFVQLNITNEKANIESLQRELECVRSEMRIYFAMLFEKGGKGNG